MIPKCRNFITLMGKALIVLIALIVQACFSGRDTSSGMDIQVQAIEVTQGVREAIPSRATPDGSNILVEASDALIHVSGRRTIVRVYPWIEVFSSITTMPSFSASLYGYDSAGFEMSSTQ